MYNLKYAPTAFGGSKVEEKLHLGAREQKIFNATGPENFPWVI
jgi:hypothetical protein